jgi:TonB-linked SusC/RagA family outer membrane protein
MLSKWTFYGILTQLIFTGLLLAADGQAQSVKSVRDHFIKIEFKDNSLTDVFEKIEQKTGYHFAYEQAEISNGIIISKKYYGKIAVSDILLDLSEEANLKFRQVNKSIIVSEKESKTDKSEVLEVIIDGITITGKITSSEDSEGLPGVNVIVKGTSQGTVTDVNGDYSIEVPGEESILVFSSVGFTTEEIVIGNRSSIDLTLVPDLTALEEIVVIGYGTQKKSDLTGAISSVGGEDLNTVPTNSVMDQAQGRLAGVDIVGGNGSPGSGQTIRIRGNRSINATNNPLYVVDGIPTTQGIEDFNPADIVSMEVLKDASAVAIYGSRGANGVILITTKRGKQGKAQITYTGYAGIKKQIANFDKMNNQQFAEFRRVANGLAKNDASQDQVLLGGMYDNFQNGITTDWIDETYQDGIQTEHQLAASGGSEAVKYFVSGSYYKEDGVLRKTNYERFSLRTNLDAKLSNKLRIGLSLTGATDLRNRMDASDPTFDAIRYAPIVDAYDEEGNIIAFPNPDEFLVTTPLTNFAPNQYIDETRGFRLFTNLFGEFDIVDGLMYRLNFGTDIRYSRRGRFEGDFVGDAPSGRIDNGTDYSYTVENILSYDKSFGEHDVSLVGLFSAQTSRDESSSLAAQGIPITRSTFYALGTAEIITGISSSLTEWGLLSYMARVNYKFKDRYLLTASGRADGSSRLAEGNKWAFFPAVSAAWIISEENFLQSNVLTFFKLRAGYGSVGNTAISPFQTQGGLARSVYNFADDAAFGYEQDGIANPDLGWEISSTLNIGLDFGLWEDRLSGTVEIYDTQTEDLLLERLLPRTSGFQSVIENVGSTRNRGWELTLSANAITSNSGFTWDIDMNVFSNKEEITELFQGTTDDIGNGWFIGHPVNTYYDFAFDGIWQTDEADEAESQGQLPGQVKIRDVNGRDEEGNLTNQPDGQLNNDDRTIIGSTVPRWSGGITNRIAFKGFDFSMLIYARQGQSLQSIYHNFNGNNWEGRYAHMNFNYWTPENPSNEYPKPTQGGGILYANALRYFDGSFVKVKNITLGYDFARSLIKTDAISGFRVYIAATNPVIWSEYDTVDPETGRALSSATWVAGVNLKF